MKRLTMLLIVLVSVGALLTACGGSSSPPKGTLVKIRLGTDATFPPFELVDYEQRKITGFDIDLMQAIAAQANLEIEFVNTGLPSVLRDVAACKYDGAISAIAITDDLKTQMKFSNPYFASGQVVVTKQGNLTLTGRDKLAGHTVGLQTGAPGTDEIQKIAGVQVRIYQSLSLAFEDLMNGLIDAVVADKPLALSYVRIPANKLKIVGDEFAVQNYAIAICSQRADLVKTMNTGLAAVTADGTLDRLTKKWITGEGR